MTQIISIALANAQAALISSTFSDGYLDFYDSDPATGTLLVPCKLPIMPFTATGDGEISLAGQWFGTCTVAGTVAWAQFRNFGGTFMNVTVSEAGGGGQIIVTESTLAYGDVVSVESFVYQAPTT